MAEKVTTMVLKVDLQCCRCNKKVKKVLCKFPQIRDQIYDEKANTVTITVVCCSPEKIRDKICCKGGGSIKSIEIKPPPPPPKPKEPEKKPEKANEQEKKKPEPEKPKEPEKKPEKPKEPEKKPEKPKEPEKKPEKPKEQEKSPPMAYPPIGFCCTDCYHGHGGGPCHFGGPTPRPCYVTYGRPVYDSWGCRGAGYNYCFTEENPQGCSTM
ncbi:protein PYRICULARIA ORYZAE RESISTANCE 21-like [Durio zibethinus]|uniref:Protein PYRICULARIA ORYZAE RESISTANCE 21-like n=1 Tax=Durio zibethinus TaxID=66656 RepID=A0A6P5X924_DURZI|nr:protein PYRICULARIA ORYZAE RESISTANCE 21-like [Durio zibethinus]